MNIQGVGLRLKHLRETVLHMTQTEFGDKIESSAALVHSMETGKRNVTRRTISAVCAAFGVARDWVETGSGEITIKNVAEPEKQYDQHGGWKPRSIEEIVGVPEGLGMGRAVEMLARIYQSKNRDVISAICANLRVFCERIDQDDELAALKREMDDLRSFVKNHAKAHAYYGEDRRSGIERRQIVSNRPAGIERRSGVDRRRFNLGNVAE